MSDVPRSSYSRGSTDEVVRPYAARQDWRLRWWSRRPLRVCFEQSRACQGVRMVADVATVIPFDHHYAGIMVRGDDADRHPGEEMAYDARMPQGVDGHFGGVEAALLHRPGKRAAVIRFTPRRPAGLDEQRRDGGATSRKRRKPF